MRVTVGNFFHQREENRQRSIRVIRVQKFLRARLRLAQPIGETAHAPVRFGRAHAVERM